MSQQTTVEKLIGKTYPIWVTDVDTGEKSLNSNSIITNVIQLEEIAGLVICFNGNINQGKLITYADAKEILEENA
jgi:hypothetical protein